MKKIASHWIFRSAVLGVAAAVLVSNPAALAKGPQYSELKKSLIFDRTPLKKAGGVVTTYADVIDKAKPAVVSVFTTKAVDLRDNPAFNNPFYRYFFGLPEQMERKQRGLGSGVIITSDGYILTNNHVVDGADEIRVSLPGAHKDYIAKIIGSDKATDVAILKIDAVDLPAATIADSSKARVGDVVLAIGNPFELEQSVTMGIISALGRNEPGIVDRANFIQTDAPINPGNSGGALIDAQGRVIGINTAIQGSGSGFSAGNIGIGFAIPVNMTLNIVERLLDGGGTVQRGLLGVRLRAMDADWAEALGRSDYSGALVDEVYEGTPADKAGFRYDDLIVEYQGKKVVDMNQLRLDIGNTPPSTEVTFKIVRNGKPKTLTTTLVKLDMNAFAAGRTSFGGSPGEKEPVEDEFLEGVTIVDLTPRLRGLFQITEDIKGVLVQNSDPSSSAGDSGLKSGDIITDVNRVPVTSVAEAMRERKRFKGNVMILRAYSPSQGINNSIIVRLK